MKGIIALAGNPNTGKTTLFNALTGSSQKVGNWPGVTVERKEGRFRHGKEEIKVVDLPGIYSLGVSSVDEQIAAEFLLTDKPELTVVVADASNLERSLYLIVQLLEMGQQVVVALNMADLAEAEGISIDTGLLEKLLGCPVVSVVAKTGKGIDMLKAKLAERADEAGNDVLGIPYGERVQPVLEKLSARISRSDLGGLDISPWLASVKFVEGDALVRKSIEGTPSYSAVSELIEQADQRLVKELGYDLQTALIERRWGFISGLVAETVKRDLSMKGRLTISDRIDRVVTSKIAGLPLFFAVTWAVFWLTYSLGDPVADWLDGTIGLIGGTIASWMATIGASSVLSSFVVDGIVGGVGSVLVFFPYIFILFAFLAILEDSGYMSRGAFVMDRIMHLLGLHGKSFIPMLMGFGCNVPAIMATRILEKPRDRMITMMVLPFMSCSARLPIFAMFSAVFFPEKAATVLFSLYAVSIAIAVLSAKLLGSTLFAGESSQLVMELPPYHVPTVTGVLRQAWQRGSIFLKKAGTIIFMTVICLWALASLPMGVEYASKESLIGMTGSFVAPIFAPAGFGFWEAGVALFFGFLAKEVVVGAFGTLFGVGEAGIHAVLPTLFSPLSAYAFMIMTLLYVPCVAVVAAVKRETNSWKWPAFMVIYTTAIAWLLSVAVFQIGRLLGF